MSAIRFVAQVVKVQTLADGGLRLRLDFSESEIETAMHLMECKRRGAVLEIAAVPVIQDTNRDRDGEIQTRSEWQSQGEAS